MIADHRHFNYTIRLSQSRPIPLHKAGRGLSRRWVHEDVVKSGSAIVVLRKNRWYITDSTPISRGY